MKEIEKYKKIVNKIIKKFAIKQKITFEYWIGDVGDIACFGDVLIFNFLDILYDLETNQKQNNIIEWLYNQLSLQEKGKQTFNYKSFCLGLRGKNL